MSDDVSRDVMTPAEIVACVERMKHHAECACEHIDAPYSWPCPDSAGRNARAAFHEANRLLAHCERVAQAEAELAAERAKRCVTCQRDERVSVEDVARRPRLPVPPGERGGVMDVIQYDPACWKCRRDAGKERAGTTWQCGSHDRRELDALRTECNTLRCAVRDLDAERQALKHRGEQAEQDRDRLIALLREVREWHRCPWTHGCNVEILDLQRHSEWIARLDAALEPRS